MSNLFQKAYDTNGGANQFTVKANGTVEVMGRDVAGYQKVTAELLAKLWGATKFNNGDVLSNDGKSSDGKGGTPNNVNITLDESKFIVSMNFKNVGGHEWYQFNSLNEAKNFQKFLEDFKAAGLLDELT